MPQFLKSDTIRLLESSIENCEGETLREEDVEIGEKRSVNFSTDEYGEGIRLMSLKEAERLLVKGSPSIKSLCHSADPVSTPHHIPFLR